MTAIESLGVVRQGVLRRKAEPLQRRHCSPASWSGETTELISPPKILFVFLQQGRQRQLNLPERWEVMVALGGDRRDRQLLRFGAIKLHATRSHSQGISPAQSSLDLRVSRLCSAARPL